MSKLESQYTRSQKSFINRLKKLMAEFELNDFQVKVNVSSDTMLSVSSSLALDKESEDPEARIQRLSVSMQYSEGGTSKIGGK